MIRKNIRTIPNPRDTILDTIQWKLEKKSTTLSEEVQNPIWFIVCKLVFAITADLMLNINQAMIYDAYKRINKTSMMGVTCGTGTSFSSGVHEFTLGF